MFTTVFKRDINCNCAAISGDCRYNFVSLSFSQDSCCLLSPDAASHPAAGTPDLSAKRLQPHEVANLSRVRKARCTDSFADQSHSPAALALPPPATSPSCLEP